MAAPARPARTRSSGGRTLILLGVLLALAAGAIVIFVVSQYTSGPTASETVVVAATNIPAGSVLSNSQTGPVGTGSATYISITAAFTTKTVNTDFAPSDAYVFKSQADLNSYLNNQVVTSDFYAGEILRNAPDPRLTSLGSGAPGSLTNINPGQIKAGDVLTQLKLNGKPAVVPGDHVDLLVTYCNASLPNIGPGAAPCKSQTTMQNLYVYAVSDNTVFVVVSRDNANELLYLTTYASNYELAIRKPGDSSTTPTTPVDSSKIISDFFH